MSLATFQIHMIYFLKKNKKQKKKKVVSWELCSRRLKANLIYLVKIRKLNQKNNLTLLKRGMTCTLKTNLCMEKPREFNQLLLLFHMR